MRRTVWSAGGCSSWYLDEHGRNVTLWPRTTYKFRQLTARFDPESYVAAHATSTSTSTDRKVSA
jgi:cyclohexanone monooxygenase